MATHLPPTLSRSTATAPPAARHPSGFSLVESLLAIVLLEVGVLALAATASGVVRMTVLGGRAGASAARADSRFEALRASVCAWPQGAGTAVTDSTADARFRERWSVADAGPARAAQVVVTYADGPHRRTDVYETVIACPR
jgi:hypothetical protein